MVRAVFNSHTNRLYFHMMNKNNRYVELKDLVVPEGYKTARCMARETIYCD